MHSLDMISMPTLEISNPLLMLILSAYHAYLVTFGVIEFFGDVREQILLRKLFLTRKKLMNGEVFPCDTTEKFEMIIFLGREMIGEIDDQMTINNLLRMVPRIRIWVVHQRNREAGPLKMGAAASRCGCCPVTTVAMKSHST
ncbi:cation/H(+) antiporter 4-like [Dorcoceras hygrometricum]|uniref:Cation/H(+) antiporter 4-like n=1 Tax=Dorcoceras hygrometricum TaxID=472368 RepID=A0A2Z7DAA5_9LAMI|nr:cation/H(+) antiporter 4-like [Dorcoceras hygrometricum]